MNDTKIDKPNGIKRGRRPDYALRDNIISALCVNPNFTEVAKQLNTTRSTVAKVYFENEHVIKKNVKVLAPKILRKAEQLLDSMTPESIDKANLSQKAIAFSIMMDKHKSVSEIDTLRSKEQENTIIVINLHADEAKKMKVDVNKMSTTIKSSSLKEATTDITSVVEGETVNA